MSERGKKTVPRLHVTESYFCILVSDAEESEPDAFAFYPLFT